MLKNRVFLTVGVLSLVLVTMAVSRPFINAPLAAEPSISDLYRHFYQRDTDWMWMSNEANTVIPVTDYSSYLDYAQRHPELSAPAEVSIDTTDYSLRHPELSAPAQTIDYSDYFARHPELGGQ